MSRPIVTIEADACHYAALVRKLRTEMAEYEDKIESLVNEVRLAYPENHRMTKIENFRRRINRILDGSEDWRLEE